MNVLAIDGLNVVFDTEGGQLHALRNVSFAVPKHRIVGVVGESGCGKSTLINAILGLLADNGQVASGRILFQDELDLTELDSQAMQEIRGVRISNRFPGSHGCT